MKKTNYRTTLLELVKTVQDCARTDAEAVLVLARMFQTRSVVLYGHLPDAAVIDSRSA